MMYNDYHQGKSIQQSVQSLLNCLRVQSSLQSMVHNLYKEFSFSRAFEEYAERGWPLTVATKQNVARVKCLHKEDPQIAKNEIQGSWIFHQEA